MPTQEHVEARHRLRVHPQDRRHQKHQLQKGYCFLLFLSYLTVCGQTSRKGFIERTLVSGQRHPEGRSFPGSDIVSAVERINEIAKHCIMSCFRINEAYRVALWNPNTDIWLTSKRLFLDEIERAPITVDDALVIRGFTAIGQKFLLNQ
jgi:hypothetical protein